MIFIKMTSGADSWIIYTKSQGAEKQLFLNSNATLATNANKYPTIPTSTLFYPGADSAVNSGSNTYIAYCFAEISGYSKFGSYIGNASTNGTFNYTGFKPSWVLIKNTTGANNWELRDNQRQYPYNLQTGTFYVNENNAEDNGEGIDMLSNGFKCRASGGGQNNANTFIYAAFGQPIVSNSGVCATAR